MKHPVTVVIPTRDRPELLVDALVSVKAAAARVAVSAEVEIIVVDNSSNDAITEQVRALTQIQGVRFLASSPAGLSRARNTGWKAGTGEFVTFLDDDDAYLPNYFQTLLAVFDANPSAGAAFGQMQMCDHRLDNPSTYAYPAGPMPSGEGLRYMLGTIVQQNAVMFRRTALADIGGYDETILTSEDWDIMMQLAAKHDVFGVEVPVCLIRQHAGLRMTNHMTYPQWVQYQRNCALVERTARTIKGRVPIAWRTRRFGRFQLHGQSAHNTLQVAFAARKAGEIHDARRFIGGAFRRSPIHSVKLVVQHRREVIDVLRGRKHPSAG